MIEVSGLGKKYGGQWVVRDLSFCVPTGTVTGFLGLNGAGKSTTMRLMLGLEQGLGTTRFGGRAYRDLDCPVRRVGALIDGGSLHPRISGRRQLEWYARAAGLPAHRAQEVLEMVGMSRDADRHPAEYSLGMKQRMGLAVALLGDPDVLVLDEPGNGMDPQGLRWIARLLRDYAERGRTVFVSSHSLAEMQRVADRVVVIREGTLVADDTVDAFVAACGSQAVLVRTDDPCALTALLEKDGAHVKVYEAGLLSVQGTTPRAIAQSAAEAGILLVELSSDQPTLEDAFLTASADPPGHSVPRRAESPL